MRAIDLTSTEDFLSVFVHTPALFTVIEVSEALALLIRAIFVAVRRVDISFDHGRLGELVFLLTLTQSWKENKRNSSV